MDRRDSGGAGRGGTRFWIPSGIVMSETPAMLTSALTLLAVVRLYADPTRGAPPLWERPVVHWPSPAPS